MHRKTPRVKPFQHLNILYMRPSLQLLFIVPLGSHGLAEIVEIVFDTNY